MPRTSPLVLFGENALNTKVDATFTVTNGGIQPFADLDDLSIEIAQKKYITFEPNMWLLDGGYKFIPSSNARAGFVSLVTSNASDVFPAQPVLEIMFSEVHSTNQMVFRFSQLTNDYASRFSVQVFDVSNVELYGAMLYPNSWEYTINQTINNFKWMRIVFYQTNKPNRFARLTGIDFDTVTRFSGADIKSANVIEAIDPLSIELPSNTLDLTIHSDDNEFSITNPAGNFAKLSEGMPLDVYEEVDNDLLHIGKFYLDKDGWESPSETEAKFQCSDAIGILDKLPYPLSPVFLVNLDAIFANWEAGDIFGYILDSVGIPYEIDPDVSSTLINGWFPHGTTREMLQQLAFAAGGYITCSRSGGIEIRKFEFAPDTVADYILTGADKGINSPLSLRPLVTGVEITAHKWVHNGLNANTVFEQSLTAGQHTIKFDNPHFLYTVTGATTVKFGVGFITINVATPGTVTITAKEDVDAKTVYGVYNTSIDPKILPNIVKIENAWFVNQSNVATITQRVYDYYQQRYLQKTKLFAPLIKSGDSVLMDVQGGASMGGIVEKMELDLANGFTSNTQIVGKLV